MSTVMNIIEDLDDTISGAVLAERGSGAPDNEGLEDYELEMFDDELEYFIQ